MWPLQDEWQVQERQHDLVAQVERQHQITLALAGQAGRTTRYAPMLIWLGRRLTTWGTRLETRYQPKLLGNHSGNLS
jgi:hypothetical protein